MVQTLVQRPTISAGDTEIVTIDYQDHLDDGELLTGPAVVEITTSDLTIENESVNTMSLVVLGRNVAIGEAVQFRVSGQIAGSTYRLRVTVTTDSSPTRTFVRDILLRCVE